MVYEKLKNMTILTVMNNYYIHLITIITFRIKKKIKIKMLCLINYRLSSKSDHYDEVVKYILSKMLHQKITNLIK